MVTDTYRKIKHVNDNKRKKKQGNYQYQEYYFSLGLDVHLYHYCRFRQEKVKDVFA